MCRRNQLCGIALITFGVGVLVGCCLEAGFFCFCLGAGLIGMGCWCAGKK